MHTFTDRDGSIDMVFPTCSAVSLRTGVGSDCLINIAYNKQIPVCPSAGSKTTDKQGNRLCRSPEQLCIADPDFRFDLSTNGNNDVRGISFVADCPHRQHPSGFYSDPFLFPRQFPFKKFSSCTGYHLLTPSPTSHSSRGYKSGWLPGLVGNRRDSRWTHA